MTTADVARRSGYSTQQVRDLERLGVIPAAERSSSGYRRYGVRHVIAAQAYRALAVAIGPVSARALMPTLLHEPLSDAAEKIDELHAALARGRARIHEARRGLDTVLSEDAAPFDESDTMTIGELAQALGIRPSALRHWESEGLVAPDRAAASRARRYRARAIAEARIVAALRGGGYPIPAIADVIDELHIHGLTDRARALLDDRLTELTRRSVALLEAAGHLHAVLTVQQEVVGG